VPERQLQAGVFAITFGNPDDIPWQRNVNIRVQV